MPTALTAPEFKVPAGCEVFVGPNDNGRQLAVHLGTLVTVDLGRRQPVLPSFQLGADLSGAGPPERAAGHGAGGQGGGWRPFL